MKINEIKEMKNDFRVFSSANELKAFKFEI